MGQRQRWSLLLCASVCITHWTSACSTEARYDSSMKATPSDKHHVIVLGIDGLGSHNVWRSIEQNVPAPRIPTLEKLIAGGAWTKQAKIDPENFSGPNWMGMITSSPSSRHGVVTNDCERGNGLDTIFKVLHTAKPALKIAVVHEWSSIGCYPEEGTVNKFYYTDNTSQTVNAINEALREENAEFIFVDFDGVDAAGHRSGGSSLDYKKAVEEVDRGIASVLNTITELGIADRTHIIVLADHGHLSEGGGHSSAQHPVPFIVYGPGVRQGEIKEEVANNQLAQLVAHLFQVPASSDWSAPLHPLNLYIDVPASPAQDPRGQQE